MKLVVEQAEVGEEGFTITGGTEGKYQSYDEGELSLQAGVSKKIVVTGYNTIFIKELNPGDKIRPPGTPTQFKITSIESDTSMTLGGSQELPEGYKLPSDIEPVAFEVLKRVDTKVVFERVLDRLKSGGAVGIFPEGGSHDRTELLPLKVGIALIAFLALDHDGINVPIVPVGLNYFGAHRWRGKLVVEYGRPTSIDPADLADFKAGGNRKRNACNKLLEGIETSMRSVIVSTPDYETLELIHTARRLYQKNTKKGQMEQRQELSRRFAEGYKQLVLQTNGKPPQEWLDLQARIIAYRNELKDLGLRDYQVPALAGEHIEENISVEKVDGDQVLSILQYLYQIAHLLFMLTVAAVPVLFLNLPVGILAGLYAERRRKKALASSKVKVRGFDVVLTEKVVFCIVVVPSLWIFYAILMCTMTDMDGPTIALAIFSMPLFAYMAIVVAEAGMVDWKFVRPVLMRLFPSERKRLAALPRTRKDLQEDLRAFIKSIGPGLGEIYYKKENLDWNEILKASNKSTASPLAKSEEAKKDR
jgi:glycerol-3-phosphate O-acyltransferase / dihydroxyacetone phosphate acyltransferase